MGIVAKMFCCHAFTATAEIAPLTLSLPVVAFEVKFFGETAPQQETVLP
jgi:hypothetical protein